MYTGTLIHTLLCMNVQSGKGGVKKASLILTPYVNGISNSLYTYVNLLAILNHFIF